MPRRKKEGVGPLDGLKWAKKTAHSKLWDQPWGGGVQRSHDVALSDPLPGKWGNDHQEVW